MSVKFRHLGHLDIEGGGQVHVRGDVCAIGHIEGTYGTTLVDVKDPTNPKVHSRLTVPEGTHSHKARLHDDLLLVNYESLKRGQDDGPRGLRVMDISDPSNPQELSFFHTAKRGVHRFDFDGRYAFISTELNGYDGNILMTVDLADPSNPVEASRWWLPGQSPLDGVTYDGPGLNEIHHALRFGDLLMTSCCNAGWTILDISDVTSPKVFSRHPTRQKFTHTVVPKLGADGKISHIIAVEEAWWHHPEAGVVISDVSDWDNPQIVNTIELPYGDPSQLWGSHQPNETAVDRLLFTAWFAHGLQVFDISDPLNITKVGEYSPERLGSQVMSNDVFVDWDLNRVYLMDRLRGLDILEFSE
ncbi:hypothetical protein [Ruegeria sp.]|uniref:LVIVD repeat-containing protein n=1 Tax=Ruegeria sp. TaxID=1879320 RepID=UPI0023145387|nr:hypothetical protein [Ruegeria sp.]MDA7965573.1 hypothetical protein [Ruegeria sp.]